MSAPRDPRYLGHPPPSWKVEAFDSGVVALRITERSHTTGMLDMTANEAQGLARALEVAAREVERVKA